MVSTRSVRYKFSEGERVLCYEPDPTKAKVLYDSKVLEVIESKDKRGRRTVEYLIHFQGWNSSWDRCVSEDFVLKDTEENRQLQRDLAEKSQLQLGAYLYRRERKKGNSTSSAGPAKRPRHGFSDDGSSSSTQPDGNGYSEGDTADTDSSSGSASSTQPSSPPNSHTGRASITLPSALRDRLTFDYHLVVKRGRLSRLPATPCAAQILESYVKWFARAGAWNPPRARHDPPHKPDMLDVSCRLNLLREVADGLRVYFDFILRGHLLYKQEMDQYYEICGQYIDDPDIKSEPSEEEDEHSQDDDLTLKDYAHLPPDPRGENGDANTSHENNEEEDEDVDVDDEKEEFENKRAKSEPHTDDGSIEPEPEPEPDQDDKENIQHGQHESEQHGQHERDHRGQHDRHQHTQRERDQHGQREHQHDLRERDQQGQRERQHELRERDQHGQREHQHDLRERDQQGQRERQHELRERDQHGQREHQLDLRERDQHGQREHQHDLRERVQQGQREHQHDLRDQIEQYAAPRGGNLARRLRSHKSVVSQSENEEPAPSTSAGEQRTFETMSSSVGSSGSSLCEGWRARPAPPPAPHSRTPLSLLLDKVAKWQVIPREDTEHLPCRVYGAIHLARLFVKLPDFLNATQMPDLKLKLILKHIDMFIQYLDEHSEWFGEMFYIGDGASRSH